jgi:hypothetical protein
MSQHSFAALLRNLGRLTLLLTTLPVAAAPAAPARSAPTSRDIARAAAAAEPIEPLDIVGGAYRASAINGTIA